MTTIEEYDPAAPSDYHETFQAYKDAATVNVKKKPRRRSAIKEKIEKDVLHSIYYPIALKKKNDVVVSKRAYISFSLCNRCQIRTQNKVPIIGGRCGSAYLSVVLCPECIEFNVLNGNLKPINDH
jgi:hypothetical protein